jgi:pyrophosphatase PpaX
MLKAIIFDIDGVLVDSREANIALFQKLLAKGGYPKPSREDVMGCFHLPLWQSLEKLTKSNDQAEIKRIWELAHDPVLRDGGLLEFPHQLEQVLETLHKQYKLAVVTSRIKAGVEDIFNQKEIRHLFDVVVTFEDYRQPKPHPEPLLVALERLNLTADEAIYIGDSESDIIAATAANMRSIHLSDTKHEHATAGIKEFQELLEAISRIAQ